MTDSKSNRRQGRKQSAAGLAIAGLLLGASGVFGAPATLSVPLDSRQSSTAESNFGDLVADSALAAAPGSQLALCPAAEIDPVTIPAGKSDTDKVVAALRSQADPADSIEVMSLTGDQIREALAHGLSRLPGPFDGFLQVAGITVHCDPAKVGVDRVVSATLDSTGRPLGAKSIYRVAMPKYLADGAMGYFDLWSKSAAPTDTHVGLSDAVATYIEAHQPLAETVEGRIVQ